MGRDLAVISIWPRDDREQNIRLEHYGATRAYALAWATKTWRWIEVGERFYREDSYFRLPATDIPEKEQQTAPILFPQILVGAPFRNNVPT